jgi:hypothetical protein
MQLFLMLSLMLLGSTPPASSRLLKFDYLKVKGHVVESTHRVKYRLTVDRSFKFLGEYHHQPTFGGKMFNVSVAAFSNGGQLVMVHAEAHRDGSGGLDYSNLKADPLDGINFTSREQCAVLAEIPATDDNPDLRFLRDKGFNAAPALFLKQYLIASTDGSAEYVLTYGKRVASCGGETITAEFKTQLEREAHSTLKIRRK